MLHDDCLIARSLHLSCHNHQCQTSHSPQNISECFSRNKVCGTTRHRRRHPDRLHSSKPIRSEDVACAETWLQDPDSNLSGGPPTFILKVSNDDELTFNFTCTLRQTSTNGLADGPHVGLGVDTQIAGLTFISASKPKEIDQLVTREFHADPNLHRKPNVQLVGDYSTGGSPSVQFNWSWKWRSPKPTEDLGGGWRNTCSVRGRIFYILLCPADNIISLSSMISERTS